METTLAQQKANRIARQQDPSRIEAQIARLKSAPVSDSYYLVEDVEGHCWKGCGEAYWGLSHYPECQFLSYAEAEVKANQARSFGYEVSVRFVDLPKALAARIERLQKRLTENQIAA